MIMQAGIADANQVSPQTAGACSSSCHRRLLLRKEVILLLQLSEDQVQQLINTRQLTTIRIAGEERFDSRDFDRMIDSYRATSLRRAQ